MKKWQKKEKRDEKLFGGKRTIRSGGLWFNPGDLKTESFLLDQKTTKHNSFSIKSETWKKIETEALMEQRMPCLSVELGDGTEFVVLSLIDFKSWFKDEGGAKNG